MPKNSKQKPKMKKTIISILAILTVAIILISFISSNKEQSQVCFENNCFNVEVAETDSEKAQGLMFRESLDKNSGMLFTYEQPIKTSFWMKNTLIPLDIIWINNNTVVYINENTQPCKETCSSITPNITADTILEINAGLIKEYNIKLGDKVDLSII